MRIIFKIICTTILFMCIGVLMASADELNENFVENSTLGENLEIKTEAGSNTISNDYDKKLHTLDIEGGEKEGTDRNSKLGDLKKNSTGSADLRFLNVDIKQGDSGALNFLIQIAKALKNLFFGIATIYFLIITIRLLFSENSEEEFGKFKKGILWITVGIIIMQLAYLLVVKTQNQGISGGLANDLLQSIVMPLVRLLETAASFFFIAIAIFSFYRIVTSAGEEEKAKSGKMSIFYAIIGFMVIKVSGLIVKTTYSKTLCDDTNNSVICTGGSVNVGEGASLIFKIINWLNGFVGIAVVIMIIYAGVQIIFSNGDEEKIKKAKTSIIYIIIGIFILTMNYFILTVFFLDKTLSKTII